MLTFYLAKLDDPYTEVASRSVTVTTGKVTGVSDHEVSG